MPDLREKIANVPSVAIRPYNQAPAVEMLHRSDVLDIIDAHERELVARIEALRTTNEKDDPQRQKPYAYWGDCMLNRVIALIKPAIEVRKCKPDCAGDVVGPRDARPARYELRSMKSWLEAYPTSDRYTSDQVRIAMNDALCESIDAGFALLADRLGGK